MVCPCEESRGASVHGVPCPGATDAAIPLRCATPVTTRTTSDPPSPPTGSTPCTKRVHSGPPQSWHLSTAAAGARGRSRAPGCSRLGRFARLSPPQCNRSGARLLGACIRVDPASQVAEEERSVAQRPRWPVGRSLQRENPGEYSLDSGSTLLSLFAHMSPASSHDMHTHSRAPHGHAGLFFRSSTSPTAGLPWLLTPPPCIPRGGHHSVATRPAAGRAIESSLRPCRSIQWRMVLVPLAQPRSSKPPPFAC